MTKIDKITTCCQKVLPLVYDESLSYYEVLCKVQQKLNELIKINNNIRDEIHKEYVEILETAKTVTEAVASVTSMRDEVLTLKQATEQYANDVVTVYNETVQARDTAIAKAEIAEQSATTATEKANIASTSATTATEKAESAEQSANTATQKANSASQSATTATEKAEIAVTNADIAKNNADKVITAMSLVAGTVNYYKSSTFNYTVTSTDHEELVAYLTGVIRNNVLYTYVRLIQTYTGAIVVPIPNIKLFLLNLSPIYGWAGTKLANIDTQNLPIISYGGSFKFTSPLDSDGIESSASGTSQGNIIYPVNLQIFSNKINQIVVDTNKTEVLEYRFTIAQPLKFVNEETPTPTDYIAKLDEEKQAREQADTTLQQNIDTLSNDVFHKNDIVPIANGGTGANDADAAFANLVKTESKQNYFVLQKTEYSDKDIAININKRSAILFVNQKINIAPHTANVIIAKKEITFLQAEYNIPETLIDARGIYFELIGKELRIGAYPGLDSILPLSQGILFYLM